MLTETMAKMRIFGGMASAAFLKFSRPHNKNMSFIMKCCSGQLKILGFIIQAIAIYMMNKLIAFQWATKLIFHDKAMLILPNIRVSNLNLPINNSPSLSKAFAADWPIARVSLTAHGSC